MGRYFVWEKKVKYDISENLGFPVKKTRKKPSKEQNSCRVPVHLFPRRETPGTPLNPRWRIPSDQIICGMGQKKSFKPGYAGQSDSKP